MPVLAAALADGNTEYRMRVAACLSEFGPEGAAAVDALLARLAPGAEDPYGQSVILTVLARIGQAASGALPFVGDILRDEHALDDLRASAADALLAIGGVTPETLDLCRLALRGRSYAVRGTMLNAIAAAGERADGLWPTLIAVVGEELDSDPRLALLALRALGRSGVQEKQVRDLLCDLAADEDADRSVQVTAVQSIFALGGPTWATWRDRVERGDSGLRHLTLRALSRQQDVPTATVVELLMPWIQSADESERADATQYLHTLVYVHGGIEPVRELVPRFLDDPDPRVRDGGLSLMQELEEQGQAVDAIAVSLLSHADEGLRAHGLDALLQRTWDTSAGVPSLPAAALESAEKLLQDPDRMIRAKARHLLDRARPDTRAAHLDAWIEDLGSDDWELWFHALGVLRELGPDAARAIPAIEASRGRFPNNGGLNERTIEQTLTVLKNAPPR